MHNTKRYLFRFKVYDENTDIKVAHGLVSSVLRSNLSLFEYIVDGRIQDSSKMYLHDFVQACFDKRKIVVFEPCCNCDSLPIGTECSPLRY